MGMEYFKCFNDYADRLARLSDQEVGRLFRALMQYCKTSVEPDQLAGREAAVFDFIRYDIDRERESYEKKVSRMNQNRSHRNVADHNDVSMTSHDISMKSVQEQEQEQDKKKCIKKKSAATFSKPTLDEIKAYAEETGHPGFDAQRFFDFYEANGWMAGRNHMKDWRAAVRNWLRNEAERTPAPKKPVTRETYNDAWKYGG